ncbi:hypothetical protein SODALDRAFT_13371 [Sodiomyces alkalinus F11]|uniref:Uncharacterized protein n=1 Tax=Sodiomyces alkalinus (strain CBS 110278 / VKM F-3762 / F11) TaxID=1314773 RepID=A0A3N2Q6D6_SODAK|nr:hypothetical protein SODALDRAFT_13371 [Sodiomyces alkalinus F11]ROT42353.1 hypothetical protein SODALDRAFT_13371 [Sodiomyces alkalinus F11]
MRRKTRRGNLPFIQGFGPPRCTSQVGVGSSCKKKNARFMQEHAVLLHSSPNRLWLRHPKTKTLVQKRPAGCHLPTQYTVQSIASFNSGIGNYSSQTEPSCQGSATSRSYSTRPQCLKQHER